MSWKDGRYYYRNKRENGRVVSEYIGGGYAGELVAQQDQMDRAARQMDRAAQKREEAAALDEERSSWLALLLVYDLAAAALLTAGLKKHHRAWRRS